MVEAIYNEGFHEPHLDRPDKLWSGQIYLAGDPKGTELYDLGGGLAKICEWKPNRLTCWVPGRGIGKHGAPTSVGRFLLLWWVLDGSVKPK